jgi:hypothetical protein
VCSCFEEEFGECPSVLLHWSEKKTVKLRGEIDTSTGVARILNYKKVACHTARCGYGATRMFKVACHTARCGYGATRIFNREKDIRIERFSRGLDLGATGRSVRLIRRESFGLL